MMNKQKLFEFVAEKFKSQMDLELSEILSLNDDRFQITLNNRLGLSMASLRLRLDGEGHEKMATLLKAIDADLD